MSNTLKALHDHMLDIKPDDARHEASACQLCLPAETASDRSADGGSVADKTYTQDEHDALVAQVDDLTAQVAELSKSAVASELDSKVAAATAELEAKVTDLQAQLDNAVLEAQTAKDEHAALITMIEETEAARVAAEELAARRDERVAAVKEVASFPDEYLEAHADRFAAMSDETFQAALEDWKAIGAKRPEKPAVESVPAQTAMTASRSNESTNSVLSEVMSLRFEGVDVRTI